jgi:predicted metal-dependent HD superfamily phosphohydrolase
MDSTANIPETDFLVKEFTTLLTPFSPSPSTIQKWTLLLLTTYSESHRYYHTTSHIASMLQHLSSSYSQIKNPTAVGLAIIFHDWEYIPHAPPRLNEEHSIVHFESFATELNLSKKLVAIVKRYIEATIKHELEGAEDESDSDLKLFLDFDLEVLGRERPEYVLYSTQIRKEYGGFSDEKYGNGRRKALGNFLKRERVFFSDSFYQRFEARARENLEWEIAVLRGYVVGSETSCEWHE